MISSSLCRTGTFLKQHNPVWAARVFGRTVKQSASAIPRPGWTKRRPEIPLQARAFSSRVSSAWKNRPPMPRPSYRLQYHEGKTIHLAYLDVAVFYLICVSPWYILTIFRQISLQAIMLRQDAFWLILLSINTLFSEDRYNSCLFVLIGMLELVCILWVNLIKYLGFY